MMILFSLRIYTETACNASLLAIAEVPQCMRGSRTDGKT